jgi:hypothetical protein
LNHGLENLVNAAESMPTQAWTRLRAVCYMCYEGQKLIN